MYLDFPIFGDRFTCATAGGSNDVLGPYRRSQRHTWTTIRHEGKGTSTKRKGLVNNVGNNKTGAARYLDPPRPSWEPPAERGAFYLDSILSGEM